MAKTALLDGPFRGHEVADLPPDYLEESILAIIYREPP